MSSSDDSSDEPVVKYVDPSVEMNLGLWFLFAGATIFLALRIFFKFARRHHLWWDDYILLLCWALLLANNSLIVHEFATGYVLEDSSKTWDQRMRLLITISSCGTLINQAWTKTAFGVTLIRMGNQWQRWILWFCIATMNGYMIAKVVMQWAQVCGDEDYDVNWRLDVCLDKQIRDDFKEGGNIYNIIMDFVFASFPWLITRELKINRGEKIGLCITMSLGMIVAIVSAIRVGWKDEGNDEDKWHLYRNGLSQVWYSSEITGTIIVQCIPILRPIVREIQSSRASRRLGSTNGRSEHSDGKFGYGKRMSSTIGSGKRISSTIGSGNRVSSTIDSARTPSYGLDKQQTHIALREISEEAVESRRSAESAESSIAEFRQGSRTARPASNPNTFFHSDSEDSDLNVAQHARNASAGDRRHSHASSFDFDIEAAPVRGLSLPNARDGG